MKEVAVYEAKTRLSELLAEVEQGEQVTITRRGLPVARLVAVSPARRSAASQRQQVAGTIAALRGWAHQARRPIERPDRRGAGLKMAPKLVQLASPRGGGAAWGGPAPACHALRH